MNKRSFIIIIIVALIAGILGAGIMYSLQPDNNTKSNSTSNPTQDSAEAATSPKPVTFDTTIPEGTISPTTLVANPQQYKDKTVQVRGLIVRNTESSYLLVDQTTTKQKSVNLNTKESGVDLSNYVYAYSSDNKNKNLGKDAGPITIKGIFVTSPTSTELKVVSVQK